MQGIEKRSEQDVIVLSLIAIYSVAVYAFAVIRYLRADYPIMILDTVLATVAMVIFFFTLKTEKTLLGSYFVAVLTTIGTVMTVTLNGAGQIFWAYPAVALLFYLLPPFHALYLWLIGAVFIVWQIIDQPLINLLNILFTLSVTSLFCLLFAFKMRQQNNNLKNMARQDVMTKVHNRRAFYEDLKSHKASGHKLTALFIDIDNFKNVNDQLGHVVGDDVLKSATDVIKDLLMTKHRLYRVGGDEFVVLTDHMNWQEVCHLSESIHQKFATSPVAQKHHLTLSIAVGSRYQDESISLWLNRLDEALYRAKKKGRDQVIFLPD